MCALRIDFERITVRYVVHYLPTAPTTPFGSPVNVHARYGSFCVQSCGLLVVIRNCSSRDLVTCYTCRSHRLKMLPVPGTANVEVLGIGSKAKVPLDGGVPKTQHDAFHISPPCRDYGDRRKWMKPSGFSSLSLGHFTWYVLFATLAPSFRFPTKGGNDLVDTSAVGSRGY
jgi:predicted RNA-binding Zn-ribbon protein involved in translation (DUF1610 family)